MSSLMSCSVLSSNLNKGFSIHPSVVCRLVVYVGTVNHEARVGVILIVDDVVVGDDGNDVLD